MNSFASPSTYGNLGGAPGASMYGSKPPKVVQLVVQTTGTYNEMYRRPYTSNLVGDRAPQVMNAITDALQRHNKLTPQHFLMGDTNFVTQNATPENNVTIANGWATPRLRFMLTVVSQDYMGNETTEFISGFTEYSDLSNRNLIDPKMRFFINSMTTTRQSTFLTPHGNASMHNIVDTSHLLVNRNFESAFSGQQVFTQAPEAIFANWENMSLSGGDDGETPSFIDARVQLTGQPIKAKRANAIAPVYSKDILDTYVQQSRNTEGDNAQLLSHCAMAVASEDIIRDPFLQHLMEQRRRQFGGVSTAFDSSFTLEDLVAIDPDARNKIEPCMIVEGQHASGMTAGWGGSDRTTQVSAILAQSLPAYMAGVGLSFMCLHSTNIGTVGGECVTLISHPKGWNSHLDQGRMIEALIYRLNTELFRSITFGGRLSYEVEIKMSTSGESWIQLSLNGEPATMYVVPSFSDALMTPVVTLNRANVDGITSSLDTISNSFWEGNTVGTRELSLSGDMHL